MVSNFEIDPGIEKCILIVDDAIENLQLLSSLLSPMYDVKVSTNGEEALEIASTFANQLSLILMDVLMPGMDGYTACDILKQSKSTRDIPVIFLTSLSDSADETRGFEVGGADFITKPFSPEVVKARIRTHLDLQEEKQKADNLLQYLLPTQVILELKATGSYTPVIHPNASVMFCDLVGFTQASAKFETIDLVNELTDLYTAFDQIIADHDGMRIKTLGDGYMAATGIGQEGDSLHATQLLNASIAIIRFLEEREAQYSHKWECRIGIHSGPVISGIVGKTRCQFDIMGDNVNIASRVESLGAPMQITFTEDTGNLLDLSKLTTEHLGMQSLKGKGDMALIACIP